MAATDLHLVDNSELERVEHWRAEEFVRAGFDRSDAIALASRHDIDLHRAIRLIELGCPHETAIQILT